MRHQKLMQKIMQQLDNYKGVVDGVSAEYLKEKGKFEKELKEMEGKYTSDYIAESRKNWKPSGKYKGVIDLARKTYQKIAFEYLNQIEKEMDRYFQIPVNSGFAATVTAIKALGVTPNNKEFELLQGASGGYWGLRLLNELGVSRTKTEQGAVLENGEVKRTEKEVKIPYGAVELPDIDKVYDSLQSVKNALNIAFKGYCGVNYELKDVVFPIDEMAEQTNAKITAEYGIEPPKQTRDAMTISKMASSIKCLDENLLNYTVFSKMLDDLAISIPEPEKKTALTDSDRNLIDSMIDSKYKYAAEEQAVKIAKADDRLADILLLDERYGAAVKAALEEVSENE